MQKMTRNKITSVHKKKATSSPQHFCEYAKEESAVGWRHLKEKHAGSGHPSFLGKTVVAGHGRTVVSSAELCSVW